MKIAVWLRRKTGMDIIINALFQIFVNLLFYKILGNSFFSPLSPIPCLFSAMIAPPYISLPSWNPNDSRVLNNHITFFFRGEKRETLRNKNP